MKLGTLVGDAGLAARLDPRSLMLRAGETPGLEMPSKLSVPLTGEGEGLPKARWPTSLGVSSLGVPCK